jgi:hypothetical protein
MDTQASATNDVLARARLTEEQVQLAIAEFLLKSEELQEAIQEKRVKIHVNWQTTKWSDPDAMVHVFFREDTTAVEEEASAVDGAGTPAAEDDPSADESATEEE